MNKRYFVFLLILSLMLAIAGCGKPRPKIQAPVRFYYVDKSNDSPQKSNVINFEIRESAPYKGDVMGLISQYVQGPQNPKLYCPIPADSYPVKIMENGKLLTVYMSSAFSRLSGIELTLAASSLGRTLIEYKNIDQVIIAVQDTMLDGQKKIVITKDSVIESDKILTESMIQK